jgi:hypothetical protein
MYGSATAILACEPYQRMLAYKQNLSDEPKSFSRLQSLMALLKLVITENINFFAKYFHSNPWTKTHYRSQVLIMWLRVRHAPLMNSNLQTIKNWFYNNVRSGDGAKTN